MAGFSKVVATIFLMLMLVFATDMVTAARICESPSGRFKGLCFSTSNCANVCHREGFTGGLCRGFRLRCLCTKHCI